MFIVVFAALRLKQQVSGLQVVGLLTAFAGIALIALGKESQQGPATSWAEHCMDTAVGSRDCLLLCVERGLTSAYGTTTVSAWSTLFGFLVLLGLPRGDVQTSAHWTLQGAAAAAYLGIVVTVAGLYPMAQFTARRSSPRRGSGSVSAAIVGISASSLMFADQLAATFLFGVGLVLCGLALTARTRRCGPCSCLKCAWAPQACSSRQLASQLLKLPAPVRYASARG